jgi:hypothetical protein
MAQSFGAALHGLWIRLSAALERDTALHHITGFLMRVRRVRKLPHHILIGVLH